LQAGKDVILEVTQIGKKCHIGCAIFKEVGRCVMPKEGIFARVLKGGIVRANDDMSILQQH
jgi:molybdopterin adenylyltransferase